MTVPARQPPASSLFARLSSLFGARRWRLTFAGEPPSWWRKAALFAFPAMAGLAAAAQWVLRHRGLPASWVDAPLLERLHAHPGWVGLALYALALALFCILLSDGTLGPRDGAAGRITGRETVLVAGIMALAAWARLYRLEELPPGLGPLETEAARRALDLLAGERHAWWQWATADLSWGYVRYVALFYRVLGPGILAVKLPAVIGSVLAVIPLYLLVRPLVRPPAALSVIALYATSRWAINLARWGGPIAWEPFWACLSLWLVWQAARAEQQAARWIRGSIAGVTLGLAFYVRPAIWPVALIAGLFALARALAQRLPGDPPWSTLAWRQAIGRFLSDRRAWAPSLVGALVMLLLALPVAGAGRVELRTAPDRLARSPAWDAPSERGGLGASLLTYVRALPYQGDDDPLGNLRGASQLESIPAALFVIGLAYALARPRRPGSALALMWCAVYLAVGIVHGPFDGVLLFGALPAILLLCGLAIDTLWSVWERLDPISADHVAPTLLAALMAWAGLDGIAVYFSKQATQPELWEALRGGETRIAVYLDRIAQTSPGAWRVYVSRAFAGEARSGAAADSPILEVLQPRLSALRWSAADQVPLPPQVRNDVIIFAEPNLASALEALQWFYPDAWRDLVRDPWGRPLFSAFVIPRTAAARRGLRAAFWSGVSMEGPPAIDLPSVDVLSDPPQPLPLPTALPTPYVERLTGSLRLTQAGGYRFRLGATTLPGALYVEDWLADAVGEDIVGEDGARTSPDRTTLWLPEGTVTLRLERVVTDISLAYPVRIEWQPPGASDWQPLPPDRLLPLTAPARGLLAAYYGQDRIWGRPTRLVRDLQIVPDTPAASGSYAVRWLGALDVASAGVYRFQARSPHAFRLWVGRQLVIDHWRLDDPTPQMGVIALASGRVSVEVQYVNGGGADAFVLEWATTDGEWQPLSAAPLSWGQAEMMQAWAPLPTSAPLALPVYVDRPGARWAAPRLEDLPPIATRARDQRWPQPQRDANFRGGMLKVGRVLYDHGVGVYGPTEMEFALDERYTRLEGAVGVDHDTDGDGVAWFEVEVDGRLVWESGPRRVGDPALPFAVDLAGSSRLVLRTHEGSAAGPSDGGDWVDLYALSAQR